MDKRRIIIVCCGAAAMLLLMFLRRKRYSEIALWKIPIIGIYLAACGVFGTMLMHYIENGDFSGTSFFGAILFVPILMLPALALKIPYGTLMDFSAPTGCVMMSVVKIDCIIAGCCEGKFMYSLHMRFPSQIVEAVVSFAIMFTLLYLERKDRNKDNIYPFYLILYGATRFVPNWFRTGLEPFVLGLPPGNFWGIVAVVYGLLWLLVIKRRRKNTITK